MKIRTATQKDFKLLLELNNELFHEKVSDKAVEHTEYSFRKEFKKLTIFIAEKRKELVGFLSCRPLISKVDDSIQNIFKGEKYIEIELVYVKKGHRKKSIGTKLLKTCMKQSKNVGYNKMFVSASAKQLNKLVKFYNKRGFETLFTRMIKEL